MRALAQLAPGSSIRMQFRESLALSDGLAGESALEIEQLAIDREEETLAQGLVGVPSLHPDVCSCEGNRTSCWASWPVISRRNIRSPTPEKPCFPEVCCSWPFSVCFTGCGAGSSLEGRVVKRLCRKICVPSTPPSLCRFARRWAIHRRQLTKCSSSELLGRSSSLRPLSSIGGVSLRPRVAASIKQP